MNLGDLADYVDPDEPDPTSLAQLRAEVHAELVQRFPLAMRGRSDCPAELVDQLIAEYEAELEIGQ